MCKLYYIFGYLGIHYFNNVIQYYFMPNTKVQFSGIFDVQQAFDSRAEILILEVIPREYSIVSTEFREMKLDILRF